MPLLLYLFIFHFLHVAAPTATLRYFKPLVNVHNVTAEASGYPISGIIIDYKANDFSGKIMCKTVSLLPLKITTPN